MADQVGPVVKYHFRDVNASMVKAFEDYFKKFENIEVSKGDIFKEGPAVDAIVSPANSFGFMDGGIDMAYSRHFGWQLSKRLRSIIQSDYDGELLVGQAIVMKTFENDSEKDRLDWSEFNGGKMINYLISAPTMRVPLDVKDTVNAYLAFRAVILAVKKHNKSASSEEMIRNVLCPGMGTAVGCMPKARCALQMRRAYETFELGLYPADISPESLVCSYSLHDRMTIQGEDELPPPPRS